MKIGLCLSGGGIKSAAHIGVIKALEEEKIKIECISGTSSGSIVAAMYAMGYTPKEMLDLFKCYGKQISKVDFCILIKLILGLIFTGKICVQGLNNGKKLEKIIQKYANKKKIKLLNDITMPLIITAVDIKNGEVCLFSSKKKTRSYSDNVNIVNNIEIGKAVQASSSYPGIFCPTDILGKKFVDGGIRENTPWKQLKDIGADKIISIVFEEEKKEKDNINILDCITRSMSIMIHELYNYELEGIECLLKLKTKDIWLLETNKTQELYDIGYNTTKQNIKSINEYLQK